MSDRSIRGVQGLPHAAHQGAKQNATLKAILIAGGQTSINNRLTYPKLSIINKDAYINNTILLAKIIQYSKLQHL